VLGVNVIVYNPKIILYITRDTYISYKYKLKIIKLFFIILKIKELNMQNLFLF